MRTICLYFEIHQIIHLKRYRFFDIGTDHYYYDDYANETSINDVAERSYIPALNTLIEMVKNSGGAFKVAFSISGVALEQLEIYAPAVIDLLHQLNDTGCCEFLAEPYSHGLSSLANEDCFKEEVMRQSAKMKQMFGKAPKVFRNSSLIYNDEIGAMVAALGFKGMLTEGAKHVLGWKSPHYVYHCSMNPNLKLLLRDLSCLTTSACASPTPSGTSILCLPTSTSTGLTLCRRKSRSSMSLWNSLLWVWHSRCLPIFWNS